MMCQSSGRPPTSTIGFGRYSVSSRMRVPRPPQRMTTLGRRLTKLIGLGDQHAAGYSCKGRLEVTAFDVLDDADLMTARASRRARSSSSSPSTPPQRHAPPSFDPAAPPVPVLRPRVRARGGRRARAHQPRLLAHRRPLARRSSSARSRGVTGLRHALLVNSGSSANLLALSGADARRSSATGALRPGDEVITVAAGFPTTVNPIIQNGLVPVFVDVDAADLQHRRRRSSRPRSADGRAPIMIAHTLGNPFDLDAVTAFCREARPVARRGLLRRARLDLRRPPRRHLRRPRDAQLLSRPPHHDGRGRRGADRTGRRCKTLVESFRDWGRDCWCEPGEDNTCGKRFDWQLGDLPYGYDHKYIYSHLGYNLKATDMQAAVGARAARAAGRRSSSAPAQPRAPARGAAPPRATC